MYMYANVETFEISGTYDLESNEINKIAYTDESPNLKILNFSSCGMFDTLYKFAIEISIIEIFRFFSQFDSSYTRNN